MLFLDCGCDCDGCDGNDENEARQDFAPEAEQSVITMVDAETGEEYQFAMVDDFEFKDQAYCVLVTLDDEEPELVITKVVELDGGEEGLMSLDEDEADEVYAEYDRLCEEAEFEDEDETEE